MKYANPGAAWLVCPRLLELDRRHGIYTEKRPRCMKGERCIQQHDHETPLLDGQGHRAVFFRWQATSDHIDTHYSCTDGCHDTLRCECGEQLVHADLDNPHTFATVDAIG